MPGLSINDRPMPLAPFVSPPRSDATPNPSSSPESSPQTRVRSGTPLSEPLFDVARGTTIGRPDSALGSLTNIPVAIHEHPPANPQLKSSLDNSQKEALRDKFFGANTVQLRQGVLAKNESLSPSEANFLLNEVTIARTMLSQLARQADGTTFQSNKVNTVSARTEGDQTTANDLGGKTLRQVDRVPAADRQLFLDLHALVDGNLKKLSSEAENNSKLESVTLYTKTSTTETIQARMSAIFNSTIPDELKPGGGNNVQASLHEKRDSVFHSKVLSPRIQQLLVDVGAKIKLNPEMRYAIDSGQAFPKLSASERFKNIFTFQSAKNDRRDTFLNDFTANLNLTPGERKELAGLLKKTIREGEISGKSIEKGSLLGKGGFGAVFNGRNKLTNEPVVVKELLKKNGDASIRQALIETSTQMRLSSNSPHVPAILGIVPNGDSVSIVMERIPGSNIAELMKGSVSVDTLSKPEKEGAQLFAFSGVVRGVEVMHAQGLSHRDLKGANAMIHPEVGEGMLIDYGMANSIGNSDGGGGTPGYIAPERLVGSPRVHINGDVWSLGVMLYEQLGYKNQLKGEDSKEKTIADGNPMTGNAEWDLRAPDGFKLFIEACVRRDPNERPTTAQMVQALNGEQISAANPGEAGLKIHDLDKLSLLNPQSAQMMGARDNLIKLAGAVKEAYENSVEGHLAALGLG